MDWSPAAGIKTLIYAKAAGDSNCWENSDYCPFGLLPLRTSDPSDYCPFGLVTCNPAEYADYTAHSIPLWISATSQRVTFPNNLDAESDPSKRRIPFQSHSVTKTRFCWTLSADEWAARSPSMAPSLPPFPSVPYRSPFPSFSSPTHVLPHIPFPSLEVGPCQIHFGRLWSALNHSSVWNGNWCILTSKYDSWWQ